jgi:tetratricopeptide (TPR) repeat protein
MISHLARVFSIVSIVLLFFALPSSGIAKEKVGDAQNCTANPGIKPSTRISACTRILKQTGTSGELVGAAILSNRASAYVQKGNYDHALRDLTVAVSLIEKIGSRIDEDPIGRIIAAGIFGNRGIVYLALNRRIEAASDFKKALENVPNIQTYEENLARLDGLQPSTTQLLGDR